MSFLNSILHTLKYVIFNEAVKYGGIECQYYDVISVIQTSMLTSTWPIVLKKFEIMKRHWAINQSSYIAIFVKRPCSTCSSPWYILCIRRRMRYLKIFLRFRNCNVGNNGSEGDLGWTPRIILTALFGRTCRCSMFDLHADPQTWLQFIT